MIDNGPGISNGPGIQEHETKVLGIIADKGISFSEVDKKKELINDPELVELLEGFLSNYSNYFDSLEKGETVFNNHEIVFESRTGGITGLITLGIMGFIVMVIMDSIFIQSSVLNTNPTMNLIKTSLMPLFVLTVIAGVVIPVILSSSAFFTRSLRNLIIFTSFQPNPGNAS